MSIEERVISCFENNGVSVRQDGKIGESMDVTEFTSVIKDLEKEFSIKFPSEFLSIHLYKNIAGYSELIKNLLNY